jgi:hypothetical protein
MFYNIIDMKALFEKAKAVAIALYENKFGGAFVGHKDFNHITLNEHGVFEAEYKKSFYSFGSYEYVYILLSQEDMNGSIEEAVARQTKALEEVAALEKEIKLALEKEADAIREQQDKILYWKLKAKYGDE